MHRGYESYSFKHGKTRTKRLVFVILRALLVAFLLYIIVTGVIVGSVEMVTVSMEPGLRSGDRVLATPLVYGIRLPLVDRRILETGRPARGDLVVLKPPYYPARGPLESLLDFFVGFFTLQNRSAVVDAAGERIGRVMVKRVIGLPGDTVRMKEFVASVKPAGEGAYRSESELAGADYDLRIEALPEGWPADAPFSGDMEPVVLGEDEYFVLGDQRCRSSDSRSWGPVHFRRIEGRVFLRYWPLRSFDAF